MSGPWSHPVRFSEAQRGARLTLTACAAERDAVAELLELVALDAFSGEVTLKPWLDGVALAARFQARLTRTCGLTLAPFEQTLAGEFSLHIVPAGSPNAPVAEEEIDLEADDPPDVLEGDLIDVAAYLVEHLALELDRSPARQEPSSYSPRSPQSPLRSPPSPPSNPTLDA